MTAIGRVILGTESFDFICGDVLPRRPPYQFDLSECAGNGNDSIDGAGGDDQIDGGGGDDEILGGTGYDSIEGGEGSDACIPELNDTIDCQADVTILKLDAPANAQVGQTVPYQLEVGNNGPDKAVDTLLTFGVTGAIQADPLDLVIGQRCLIT